MNKKTTLGFLPLFHNVQDKSCVVVGGGETASRKIQWLLKAGATITVVGDDILAAIEESVTTAGGICIPCDVSDTDTLAEILAGVFSDCVLVIGASDDHDCNVLVSALANLHNIPVNIVDAPELCSFIFPSIVERGALTIAVSTGGNAPVMARLVRAKLESWLPLHLSSMVEVAGNLRERIRQLLPETRIRMRFWDAMLQDSLIGASSNTTLSFTEDALLYEARDFKTLQQAGSVNAISLDSCEPDHLRFFQLRLLQATDVLVFEEALPESIQNLARRDAERVRVNKSDAESIAHIKSTEGLRVLIIHYSPAVAQNGINL